MVVEDGFFPALSTRPNLWLHTRVPLETNATDTEVAFVCFITDRTALRPCWIVVLKVGGGCFCVISAAWTAGTPPITVAVATADVKILTTRMNGLPATRGRGAMSRQYAFGEELSIR
jgi:hypothetical protein